MYSTNSMLRTMELILGLKPLSQVDAELTQVRGRDLQVGDDVGHLHLRSPTTMPSLRFEAGKACLVSRCCGNSPVQRCRT